MPVVRPLSPSLVWAVVPCSEPSTWTLLAQMSCNPAIGGLAKGHLAEEIDALGGEMARNIDATGIHSCPQHQKGPGCQSLKGPGRSRAYRARMKQVIEGQAGGAVSEAGPGRSLRLRVSGFVELRPGRFTLYGPGGGSTTGTFMRGLIHVGLVVPLVDRARESRPRRDCRITCALGYRCSDV